MHTSGNPTLAQHVIRRGRELELPAAALERFRREFERDTGVAIDTAAAAAAEFRRLNDPAQWTDRAPGAQRIGYQMKMTSRGGDARAAGDPIK